MEGFWISVLFACWPNVCFICQRIKCGAPQIRYMAKTALSRWYMLVYHWAYDSLSMFGVLLDIMISFRAGRMRKNVFAILTKVGAEPGSSIRPVKAKPTRSDFTSQSACVRLSNNRPGPARLLDSRLLWKTMKYATKPTRMVKVQSKANSCNIGVLSGWYTYRPGWAAYNNTSA